MTTLVDAREAIYQAFATAWGSTTPLAFDNEKFVPPDAAPWVRLAVRHQVSNQETLGGTGNRVFLREGLVFVQVFTPEDDGQRASDVLVQQARAVFEGVNLVANGVWFNDVVVREIGPTEGWNQVNAEAAFFYQEIK